MDFPEYVPTAAREHITAWLEKLAPYLKHAKSRLEGIERAIENAISDGKSEDFLTELRRTRINAKDIHHTVKEEADCLQRLAGVNGYGSDMQEAYSLLTSEITDDVQWKNFINAAVSANKDFSAYRKELERMKELAGNIEKTARELANMIRQFNFITVDFSSLSKFFRHPDAIIVVEKVAESAGEYEIEKAGWAAAATASRKDERKTAYVRAFWCKLSDYGFNNTPKLKKAMAATATVVLGEAVTYENVRDALDKRKRLKT